MVVDILMFSQLGHSKFIHRNSVPLKCQKPLPLTPFRRGTDKNRASRFAAMQARWSVRVTKLVAWDSQHAKLPSERASKKFLLKNKCGCTINLPYSHHSPEGVMSRAVEGSIHGSRVLARGEPPRGHRASDGGSDHVLDYGAAPRQTQQPNQQQGETEPAELALFL